VAAELVAAPDVTSYGRCSRGYACRCQDPHRRAAREPEQGGVPGKVVIRIHFTDFTGKIMFHCHIAAHEVAGMTSFINVVKPPPGYNHALITPKRSNHPEPPSSRT
jgi:hypothetical protein